jgi:hypothetical protein
VIPTCSSLWTSGDEFKKRFDAILRENYATLAATIFFLFGLRKRGRYCGTETTTIGIMASHHIVITVRHTRMQIPSQASLLDVVAFSH